ncbi:MAG: hypothetical protein ACLSVD_07650 [Eggerthellaceae bacterium]
MAATVKTLLEHHGELYWGTQGQSRLPLWLALDVGADGLAAELVYVMSDPTRTTTARDSRDARVVLHRERPRRTTASSSATT